MGEVSSYMSRRATDLVQMHAGKWFIPSDAVEYSKTRHALYIPSSWRADQHWKTNLFLVDTTSMNNTVLIVVFKLLEDDSWSPVATRCT